MTTRLLALLALTTLSCTAPAPPPSPEAAASQAPPAVSQDALERARGALAPLKSDLKTALMAALPDGPVAALDACRSEAPLIAARASAGGVAVGRTSDRLRNAANVAQPWMQPLLAAYAAGSEEPYMTAPVGDGAWGYVEPIRVQALCTTCHGGTLEPQLIEALDRLYPLDRARGYEVGELRGLFWAIVPADS